MKNYARLLWLAFFAMVIAVGLLLVPGAKKTIAAPDVIIDGFDEPQDLTATGATNPVSGTVSGSTNLIGGFRKLWVYRTSGSGNLQAVANNPLSKFTHNPDSDVRGITRVTWDGTGGDPTVLNFNLNANLSNEHAIVVALEHVDYATAAITFTVYSTNTNHCSRLKRNPATPNNSNNPPMAMVFRFTDFTTACSNPAAWSDIDAIVMEIDTTAVDGNDVRIQLVVATKLDYGDWNLSAITNLPAGAGHTYLAGLSIGNNWDAETNGQPNLNLVGDDNTGQPDDEDGVVAYGNDWSPGNSVSFTVRINGNGCLSGWIDWGKNNIDDVDRVITNAVVSTGVYTYTLTVPNEGQVSPYVYRSRFRLFQRAPYDNGCPVPVYNDSTGEWDNVLPFRFQYFGGEVEDHLIGRAPTAVTLTNLSASAASMDPIVPLVGIVGGVGILGLLAWRRRRN